MILYKGGKTLVDLDHTIINSSMFFDNTSIDLHDSISIFVIEKTAITNLTCKLEYVDGNVSFAKILDSEIYEKPTTLNDSEIDSEIQNNYYIRKFTILFSPDSTDLDCSAKLNISYDSINSYSYTTAITGYGVEMDKKLIEMLQNFGVKITDDYYTAFKASDTNESIRDAQLMNHKRKQYMYQIMEMTAYAGTYLALDAAINYFGWGELLTVREIWVNDEGQYTYTNVDYVLDSLSPALTGFSKTNQIKLCYNLNVVDTDDDGNVINDEYGLEQYVSVVDDWDSIKIKLYALKRVLETDFLLTNTVITDITGEYKAIVGSKTNVWTGNNTRTREWMNDPNKITFETKYETLVDDIETAYIRNHKLIMSDQINEINETYETLSNVWNPSDEDFLEVESALVDYDFDDDDYLTKYHEHDLALYRSYIEYDESWYSRYKFRVLDYDTREVLFDGKIRDLSSVKNYVYLGIHKLGEYLIQLILFDNWGGVEIVSNEGGFKVIDGNIDFKMVKLDTTNTSSMKKDLQLLSTFPTTDGMPFFDSYDTSFNINSTNESVDIKGYYSTGELAYPSHVSMLDISGIPLKYMDDVRLEDFGYTYGYFYIDIIGDGSYGLRDIKLRYFEHNDWEVITSSYDGSNYLTFLKKIVSQFNNKGGIFDDFTITIDYYTSTGLLVDKKPILRMQNKNGGYTSEKIYVESKILTDDALIYTEDKRFFLPCMSMFYQIFEASSGTLNITVDDFEYSSEETFNDIDEYITKMYEIIDENELDIDIIKISSMVTIMTSKSDVIINHLSVGNNKDVVRGDNCSSLKYTISGDEWKVGEPIYAFLNDEYKLTGVEIEWEVKNTLTKESLYIKKSQSFIYNIFEKGSYDLILRFSNTFGDCEIIKEGCILVI